jgi:hypothetical protein
LRALEFQGWRHHPVSRLVLQFLEDYRDARLLEALDAFWSGTLGPLQEQELRGRARLADEIVALAWEDILRFYGAEPVVEPEETPS